MLYLQVEKKNMHVTSKFILILQSCCFFLLCDIKYKRYLTIHNIKYRKQWWLWPNIMDTTFLPFLLTPNTQNPKSKLKILNKTDLTWFYLFFQANLKEGHYLPHTITCTYIVLYYTLHFDLVFLQDLGYIQHQMCSLWRGSPLYCVCVLDRGVKPLPVWLFWLSPGQGGCRGRQTLCLAAVPLSGLAIVQTLLAFVLPPLHLSLHSQRPPFSLQVLRRKPPRYHTMAEQPSYLYIHFSAYLFILLGIFGVLLIMIY